MSINRKDQQEHIGVNALQHLGLLLNENKVKNAFFFTGKHSYLASGAKEKIEEMCSTIKIHCYNEFSSNPTVTDVQKALPVFRQVKPDVAIGVGGGSVLDMAKMVTVLSAHPKPPLQYITGKTPISHQGVPLIAIPTTSGTGSESTHFATVYHEKQKFSLAHPQFMLPDMAIIDPLLTISLSKKMTAITGLDALCQGIESLWAVGSTEESRTYAQTAIREAVAHIQTATHKPDLSSRLGMAQAAHWSGKAINISKTTACHSLSYPMTSWFDIPHGLAVSLTMSEMIKFNEQVDDTNCNDSRGAAFVKNRIQEIIDIFRCKDATQLSKQFLTLLHDLEVPSSLSELGISAKNTDKIIKYGFTKNRMQNNPRTVTQEDVQTVVNHIL